MQKLGIHDVVVVLRASRMRWLGHVERSTGWIAHIRKHGVVTQARRGRLKKTWDEVVRDDRTKHSMNSIDPHDRSKWRGRLKGRLLVRQAPSSVED